MAKKYWIMKSEPSVFGIDDLERRGKALWDGVRNYQVRNMFRDDMNVGDCALFYHSNAVPLGIVGEMIVTEAATPDPTQFVPGHTYYDPKSDPENPRWLGPVVTFVKRYDNVVTLDMLKANSVFSDLPFVQKGNRLSVIPITKVQYEEIVKLAKK
jgi:predicted RNA-binding protein with PUA-like domain